MDSNTNASRVAPATTAGLDASGQRRARRRSVPRHPLSSTLLPSPAATRGHRRFYIHLRHHQHHQTTSPSHFQRLMSCLPDDDWTTRTALDRPRSAGHHRTPESTKTSTGKDSGESGTGPTGRAGRDSADGRIAGLEGSGEFIGRIVSTPLLARDTPPRDTHEHVPTPLMKTPSGQPQPLRRIALEDTPRADHPRPRHTSRYGEKPSFEARELYRRRATINYSRSFRCASRTSHSLFSPVGTAVGS